jgi:hypothetical protein
MWLIKERIRPWSHRNPCFYVMILLFVIEDTTLPHPRIVAVNAPLSSADPGKISVQGQQFFELQTQSSIGLTKNSFYYHIEI